MFNWNFKIKMFQEFQNENAPTVYAQNQQHVNFQNTMHGKLDNFILVQQIKSLQLKKAKIITTTNIFGILIMAKLPPFIN
jgi:hypothetical protein